MPYPDAAATADLNTLKRLGHAHLDANQVEKAMQVFARILRDYPQDLDAYLVMGDCYLADGDPDTALLFYSQALEHAPEDPELQRRIRLARLECVNQWNGDGHLDSLALLRDQGAPVNPEAVAGMIKEIIPQTDPVTETDVLRAAQLLNEIIHHPAPAQAVAQHLDEIDTLLPALLELNIRQAQADGRTDIVEGLQALQRNIQLQLQQGAQERIALASPEMQPAQIGVLLVAPDYPESSSRGHLIPAGLERLGCRIQKYTKGQPLNLDGVDVVLALQPHLDNDAMETLAQAHSARLPVLLDLEADLEQMPVSHPSYETIGLGVQARARAYATALLLADVISTPSGVVSQNLQALGYQSVVMPEGWDNQDTLWSMRRNPHATLNLGWVGQPGEVEDVFQVRRMVVRVLREFPHTHIVVAGDPAVYQLFDSLPDSRRTFLPVLGEDELPYVFAQLDILMLPFRNTPFNQMRSDQRLMQAGVAGVPWLSSPLPSFQEWNTGGLIANTPDEWHTHLRQLVLDAELRQALAKSGQQKAQHRRMDKLANRWLRLFQDLIKTRQQPAWQPDAHTQPAQPNAATSRAA